MPPHDRLDDVFPGAGDPARGPFFRREILTASLGLLALAALGGCSTSSSRRSAVGDPIPQSPRYRGLPPERHESPARPQPGPGPSVAAVIKREAWAKRPPDPRLANRMGRIEAITVHHDAVAFSSTALEDAARRIESIRSGHVRNGWADIGYHYAVDPAGRVWEARPENLQGAHVKDQNERNLGVVVLGNFESQAPTDAALRAVDAFVAAKMKQHRVSVDRVFTHRELAKTACPGRNLQSHMLLARGRSGSIRTALADPDSWATLIG